MSGVYQNYQGAEAQTNWLISRTTRYAADCVGPCTPGALVVPAMTEASLTIPLKPAGVSSSIGSISSTSVLASDSECIE